MNDPLHTILTKCAARQRLSPDEAVKLAVTCRTPDGLHRLGVATRRNCRARFGGNATFVCNLHINPSNLCEGRCRFCRFSARPDSPNAYEMSEEEIFARIDRYVPTEVHIVGGLNRVWGFRRSLALVQEIHRRFPDLYVKAYTAVEIDWFARCEGMSIEDVLTAFRQAGLAAMPGGGAEVFSARVRRRHCPGKLDAEGWLDVHRKAHGLGITTNATMLYGCGETPLERVDHLLALRRLQDETGGFQCFIPLAFQSGDHEHAAAVPPPLDTLAVIALSRCILDNFPHVKAYWPMIGLEVAAAALSWGADDLDGTIGRERIAHAGGATAPTALGREQMLQTIRLGGFIPVERDGLFLARQ